MGSVAACAWMVCTDSPTNTNSKRQGREICVGTRLRARAAAKAIIRTVALAWQLKAPNATFAHYIKVCLMHCCCCRWHCYLFRCFVFILFNADMRKFHLATCQRYTHKYGGRYDKNLVAKNTFQQTATVEIWARLLKSRVEERTLN